MDRSCPATQVIRSRNYENRDKDLYQSLQNTDVYERTPCTPQVCLASLMVRQSKNEVRSEEELLRQAKDFFNQYFTSIGQAQSPAHTTRWDQVCKEVEATGTYQLTEAELVYGAKLAWRNSPRCIARIHWDKLQVFDCRSVTTSRGMFEAICNHIKYSTNEGNIRAALTIFPQRTDGKHDFRVWNPSELINYAGYRRPDGTVVGDPANVQFTELCRRLGWKGSGGRWDVLPLVLSADGHDPDFFDIPRELLLEVPLVHPTFDWFEELGLRWYAMPAVSHMMLDCGGLQFTAAPFSGWYTSPEIGCRALCDKHRFNMLETVAVRMGLDVSTPLSLWKDKAMVECNLAVLHSFQAKGVAIVDHHTISESFMKHLENESRLRNGCPADWVWIVPPMSGSATPVFHQEMALYYLKPSYEYQVEAWKSHVWEKGRDSNIIKKRKKLHFTEIARAVKFTSKLFGRALSRRIKATVLYATETGRSEGYAKRLGEVFGRAFNARVHCMADYDVGGIEHEALLLVVASTFGNGDPPENGEGFGKNLHALKIRKNEIISNGTSTKLRFAVFGLGSSAYPNFCAFGRYVDNLLSELGGERLLRLTEGDEMCGQEQTFQKWAPQIFKVACETFCLDDDDTILEATLALQTESLTAQTVRFVEGEGGDTAAALGKCHGKKVTSSTLLRRTNLLKDTASEATLLLEIENHLSYNPGDHVGVYAMNRPELVDQIISRLKGVTDPDAPVEIQIIEETHTSNGIVKNWKPHEKLPVSSVRHLFTRYLDITTPPSPNLLQHFASIATDEEDKNRLHLLATDSAAYEDWRHWRFPNLSETLEEFQSVAPFAPLLIAQLPILQPRFYSISSSPLLHPNEVHLTVAVVVYRTEDGNGPEHFGVCSNYLQNAPVGSEIFYFIRSAPNFNLPADTTKPLILVGPGTGIAPFRAFWQHRYAQLKANHTTSKIWLFFGCRTKEMDLYKEEKEQMLKLKVFDKKFLALSREPNLKKTYVQDIAIEEAKEIYRFIVLEKGHFYVCGDCTMAEDVHQTLKQIVQMYGMMSDEQVKEYLLSLKDENRYHEDIFGITLRTAEVRNRSRESAIRKASEPQQ